MTLHDHKARAVTVAAGQDTPPSTPNLHMDLAVVNQQYQNLVDALPFARIHYAMKCNPSSAVLVELKKLGCRFEIASEAELEILQGLGVNPAEILFSNPVKPPAHISSASQAGVERFAFDSIDEIEKLATCAPGSKVYVRIAADFSGSEVPSEGKFGVDTATAVDLLVAAQAAGLEPWGVTFHVGSQMTELNAWEEAIAAAGTVMSEVQSGGIRLGLLDIGGGFPVRYDKLVPSTTEIGNVLSAAMARYLPYEVEVVAEPGRALVANAGVLSTTVIGVADRAGKTWLHLDVGAFNGLMESLETRNGLRYQITDSHGSDTTKMYNLTGPTCDSQDSILFDVELSTGLRTGDVLTIHGTGAYTVSYASSFNGFAPPSVFCQ